MKNVLSRPARQTAARPPRTLMVDDVPLLRLGSMNEGDLHERLQFFARRSLTLCGTILVNEGGQMVPKPIGATLSAFFNDLLASTTDPAKIKQRTEFLQRVEGGDPVAKAQFCAARMETFNNFISAQLPWISQYANVVTLQPDEWPVHQNSTMEETTCYFVGEDGTPQMSKVRKEDPETRIALRYLTTPVVRIKEFDLYRGSVVSAALAVLRMSFDLANKENYEFFALLKSTAFVTAFDNAQTKKQKNAWQKVSYIDANNLPSGNDITVTGASGSTYFDFATLDEIIDYAMRFDGLSPEGNLRPTGLIRLPSSHVRKFGSGVTPSGATSNPIADNLLENGWTGINYRRVNWVFVGDPTLPASEYICYPEFNMKPASVYHKPAANAEVVRTGQQDNKLFEANEQERQLRIAYGAAINTANIRKLARFKYKT